MRGLSIALMAVVACGSDTGATSGPPGVLMPGFTRTELANGLDVLVLPDHSVPLVTATMVLHSGAFVEDEAESGYSHLLEHMLFKANELEPDPEQLMQELRRRGILRNALTGRDLVAYYYLVPTDQLHEGLELFAASLRSPVFDEGSLQTEIDVVLAEYDRSEADLENVLRRRASALLFPQHPNRVDPLGRRDTIADATPEALRELYATYYVPNNACLILIGDVDADAGVELAKRYFGDWAKAPDPFRIRPVPDHPALTENSSEVITADVHLSRLIVSFRGPSNTRSFEDSVAADLLAQLTRQTDHEFRGLVGSPEIVSASFSHVTSPDSGQLTIELGITEGHEAEALRRLRALGNFADRHTPEQLDTARDQLWSRHALTSDSNLGLSLQLAVDWALGKLEPGRDPLSTLYELGPSDLEHFWERYISGRHAVAVLLTNPKHVSAQLERELKRPW